MQTRACNNVGEECNITLSRRRLVPNYQLRALQDPCAGHAHSEKGNLFKCAVFFPSSPILSKVSACKMIGVVVKCCTSVICRAAEDASDHGGKNIRLNMSNYLLNDRETRRSADCHVLHYAKFPNPQIPSQVSNKPNTGLTRLARPQTDCFRSLNFALPYRGLLLLYFMPAARHCDKLSLNSVRSST